jgi:acyl carrier protein
MREEMEIKFRKYGSGIESSIRGFITSKLLYSKESAIYSDDASLLNEGIIDSLGVVDLVRFLELTFQIKIEEQEVRPENIDSVSRIAAFVRRKTKSY